VPSSIPAIVDCRAAGSRTLGNRHALFTAYSVALMFAGAHVLAAVVKLSIEDASSSHLVLIPFISAALIYGNRGTIFSSAAAPSRLGLALISAALIGVVITTAYHPLAESADALTLQVTALLLLWSGGFLLCYGLQAARAALFPLLFLVLMIPIPHALLRVVIRLLTQGTSEVLAGLFALVGTPYLRHGTVFSFPGVSIRIADECSGIRSTISLIIVGALAAKTCLTKPWTRAVFAAALVAMSVVKNAIRIATLTLLAIHVDKGFLTGRLHQQGGIVFFLATVMLLAPLLVILRRSERVDDAPRPARASFEIA
jgi:exosortase